MLGTLQQMAAAAMESNCRLDHASLLQLHHLIQPEATIQPQMEQTPEPTIQPKPEPSTTPVQASDTPSESSSPGPVKTEEEEDDDQPRLQIVEPIEPRPVCPEFRAGSRFSSFAEFEAAFEAWKSKNFHPFRVASSETLRMPDGSANELFKYRYIVYHCAHYGAPRMRGAGKRPNQNYLPCGCRAMLRLNFGWADNALRITTLNDRHSGHEVSAENFYKFKVKVRRPSATPPPRSPSTSSALRRTTPIPPLPSPVVSRPNSNPLANSSNLAALSLAASLVQAQQAHFPATSLDSPVSAASDQENENPLDLRVERDTRTEEERFAQMHAPLQALTDHLLACRGPDFDSKLRQLRIILRSWDLHKTQAS